MPRTPPGDSDSRHGPRVASLVVADERRLTEAPPGENKQTCCTAAAHTAGRYRRGCKRLKSGRLQLGGQSDAVTRGQPCGLAWNGLRGRFGNEVRPPHCSK